MKVLIRILTKLLILVLVIAGAGGGAGAWKAWKQSTPDYTIGQYLTHLTANESEEAFAYLDQSESTVMTSEEYADALEQQDYVLYSGFRTEKGDIRRDERGNEYVDYRVEFLNAADEAKAEQIFTVKKQPQLVLGVFDSWKVMADHCLVQDYEITAPAGSEVYLDGRLAREEWIVTREDAPGYDHYVIPTLIPGKHTVTIRHDVLAEVSADLDVTDKEQNYSGKMKLKESAQNECKELGVKALKTLFSNAVKGTSADTEQLFNLCREDAEAFVQAQGTALKTSAENFRHIGVSDFKAQFTEPVFTDEGNGVITTEMTFSYHCIVCEEVTYESGEYLEDGTPEYITEKVEHTDDVSAKLKLSYFDKTWHIESMEIPVILQHTEQPEV